MGKIVKKVDLEKAGIETRVSKGDLVDQAATIHE